MSSSSWSLLSVSIHMSAMAQGISLVWVPRPFTKPTLLEEVWYAPMTQTRISPEHVWPADALQLINVFDGV